MKLRFLLGLLISILTISGCKSAYYGAWEKFGVYKRDLLKKKVIAARDDEKAAGDQFKSALARLKELYGFSGGNLERTYESLNSEYERSVSRAEAVHKRIKDVEGVAADLFAEWEKELNEISSEQLRSDSRRKMSETRQRYDDLHSALKKAERSMDPVLTRLHDQVLYLKHNLNAAAIASLKGETTSIQGEISGLIEDMNRAIQSADQFIKNLQ